MPIRLTDRLRRGLGARSSGVDPSLRLLPPLRSPVPQAAPPAATGARVSLRRLAERCAGPATIVAAVAIGVLWLAALLALDREPPSPPLGPARAASEAAIGGDAQRPRLRSVPELPAQIAPERRHARRKHERRRARPSATTAVRPRAVAPAVVTSTPTPQAVAPAPTAAPPPAPAPPRPEPRRRDTDGQTFDSSG
jgi:hypothetical protein